jgi:hypothetical protein
MAKLPGRFLDMGSHQDHARPPVSDIGRHGRRGDRLGRQCGERGEQARRAPKEEALALSRRIQHLTGEAIEIRLALGVHHAADVTGQGTQPRTQIAADILQTETLDRLRPDAPVGLLLHIIGQKGVAEPEHRVTRELGLVDRNRHPVDHQIVDAIARDPPALEEGRHQKVRIEGAELLGDHIGLDRIMAAQGGIRAADDQWPDSPTIRGEPVHRRAQVHADLARHPRRLRGIHAARVAQNEEEWRGILERLDQGLRIPSGQQQTAVDGLGSGRVVVDDDDLGV